MKKVLLLLLMSFLFAACGGTERETIIMGTSADFPPFEFVADDGQGRHGHFSGIDVAIAVRIADALDMDLEIHDSEFGGLIPDLMSGRIDFIAAAMTITEERRQSVAFSEPYYTAMQYIVVQIDDDRVASTADLDGLYVGVQIATTGDLFVTENVAFGNISRYNRANEAFTSLRSGRLDAVVIDSAVAMMFVGSFPTELKIIRDMDAFENESYGIAVRLDDTELLAGINAVIREMKANGEIEALFAYYAEEE
jgi:polar amino acid transport system substrate-binding protein